MENVREASMTICVPWCQRVHQHPKMREKLGGNNAEIKTG